MSRFAVFEDVIVRHLVVSKMENNVFLITHRGTGAQVLLDAADDADQIMQMLEDARADAEVPTHLDWIITTHQHWDHIRALREVHERTGAPLAAGALDAEAIEQAEQTAGDPPLKIDRVLHDQDVISVPGFDLTAVHLRGHTPGSIALVLRPQNAPVQLFTGDSLFQGGVGNTWGDAGRFRQLLQDVTERLFGVFDDDARVHPGHGQSTTLGAERDQLAAWRARGW